MTRVTAPVVRPMSSDSRPAVADAAVEEHLEGLDVRLGQAEPDGDGLAEERALEVDPAEGPEDRIDVVAIHG